MVRFMKAKREQELLKVALYGKPSHGKTLTSLLWAEGLANRQEKRIAFIDTERDEDFYTLEIPPRSTQTKKSHPSNHRRKYGRA